MFFLHREFIHKHGENSEVLKIKGCTGTKIVVGCGYNLLVFEANFELGKIQVFVIGCTGITFVNVVYLLYWYLSVGSGSEINVIF